jgi:iron complex outermembrane receptor protein
VVVALIAAFAADPPSETVVVTADRPLEARSPASVTVLAIDDRIPEHEDLAEVVGRASGASITRLGGLGDLATVRLRGSTARQVEVYLDGVPLNPDGSGAVDLSELPLRAFSRIEVWRGNAPVGLGGTAMGGVVNLITGDGSATAFGATGGSFDSATVRALVSRDLPVGDLWVSANALSTSGDFRWYDDGGTLFTPTDDRDRPRANNVLRMGGVNARYRFGEDVRFTAFDSLLVRDEAIPGPTSAPTEAVRFRSQRNLTVLQAEGGGVRARVHHRVRNEVLLDPRREVGLLEPSRNQTHSLALDLQGTRVLSGLEVTGVTSIVHDQRVQGGRRLVWRGQVGTTAVKGPLTVAPILSAVSLWSREAGEARTFVVLPRLGVLGRLRRGVVVKGNVGRTFRPPGLTELFGNRGPLVGRSDLAPERGVNVDAALRIDGEAGSLEVGGFATWSRDLIVYVQNAQRIGIPTNLGAARVFGVEGALTWTGVPWLDWTTNLTVQRTINDAADPATRGRRIPRLPWLQLDQQTAVRGRRWRVGHTFSVADGLYVDAANLQRQAVRPLHGVFTSVELGAGVRLGLDVRNALDRRTVEVPANPLDPTGPVAMRAITDFSGYPLPGRSFWVSLRGAR